MVRKEDKKGITLITLVITVIVLMILASITIGILEKNGILSQSNATKEDVEISEEKKILNISVVGAMEKNTYGELKEEQLNKQLEKNIGKGEFTLDSTTIKDKFIVTFTDSERDYLIDEDGHVEKYVGTIVVDVVEITPFNVKISVTAIAKAGVPDNPEYKYYIKKASENSYPDDPTYTGTDSTYNFKGLQQNTKYNIKVTTVDKLGNEIIGEKIVVTGKILDGEIAFGIPVWSEGKASVTITSNTDYTMQYQINSIDGEWTQIEKGGTVSNLNHEDTVYARLIEGKDAAEYASITILDLIKPTINVNVTDITTRSMIANVTAVDNETGLPENPIYSYYIKKSSDSSYPSEPIYTGTDISYKFDELDQSTSYDIKVTTVDNANNIGAGISLNNNTGTIPDGSMSGAIIFGTPVWSGGTASVTISSNTSYIIQYQINGTEEGKWTQIQNGGTLSNLNNGDTINARLTDGKNYGKHVSLLVQDLIGPKVNVTTGSPTTRSIVANVTAVDNETGMPENPIYSYYIKKSSDSSYPSEATYTGTETSYKFDELDQTTSYDIKVTTVDKVGNIGTGTALDNTTGTVPSGKESGVISFGTPTWSNEKASVTISTNKTGYTLEYKINSIDGTWTPIQSGGTVSNLSHNDTVYARLTDGKNAGDYASVTITDGVKPTISSFGVTDYEAYTITVATSAVDNESGIQDYTYQYKKSTESTYKTATTTTSSTYQYTNLTDGTTYNLRVIVKDKAGNTQTKDATQTTVIVNRAPVFTTQGYAYSKTTSSITIRATATDSDGDSLTYKLYTGTSSSNLTLAATSSATSSGTTVSLSKSSLSEYKTYYFRMDVTDGKATTTGTVSSVRTYCSGTTYTCTTSRCTDGSSSTCSTCDGAGYKLCSTCSGSGKVQCKGGSPQNGSPTSAGTCPKCNIGKYYKVKQTCPFCGKSAYWWYCGNSACGYVKTTSGYHGTVSCSSCGGDGLTSTRCTKCSGTGTRKVYCDHGYAKSHRYCSHYDSTTKTSHYYCSHNYNGVQH